jgi:ribosome-associated toxin RatA of RatAB toxin-antitoxin module
MTAGFAAPAADEPQEDRLSDVVSESIVIASDPDSIMDVIADFEAYPDWQPEIKEVEVLETDDDGWGTRVRFVVDAKIMKTTLVLEYTYGDNEMRWVLTESDQLKKNDGSYTLEDQGDGTTNVRYDLEVVAGMPLPGMLRRRAAKQIIDAALKSLKHRVESGS